MGPTLGFVGLGNIGAPICQCLLNSGYDVTVYDVDPDAMARFDGGPARLACSLAGLASSVDAVILSLPNSAVVEGVVFGDGGLSEGLSEGKVLIDTSSSKPSSTRRLSARLGDMGVQLLDAPVSGGVARAKEGKLAVMVGGEKEAFERYRGLLSAFGSQVFYVGESGAGHLTKAINNLISATTLASAAEAVLLGVRAGLDPAKIIEVVNASSGRSNSTETKFPRHILNGAFDDGFAVGLMNKDVKIALETAAELDQPMLIGASVGQVWQAAMAQGYAPEGHTAIYAFLEGLTEQ